MTIEQVELLFQKMLIIFSRHLPSDENLRNILKQEYYNHLKDYDVELVARNYKEHVRTSNYLPTIADLVKKPNQEQSTVPGVEQTRLMIAQRDAETPEQNVDKEFIKEQIRIAREKIAEVRLNELKRDFDKSFK